MTTTLEYSDFPELVDIKVTDHCTFGCTYCYQNSTADGKHGKLPYNLKSVLKHLDVVEVAVGGGEPMQWPPLTSLVNQFSNSHIAVNVTTRDPIKAAGFGILEKLSGVGYSVDSAATLKRFIDKIAVPDVVPEVWKDRLNVHVVLGAVRLTEVKKILDLCEKHYLRVLLLDYKTSGRGKEVSPFDYDNWIYFLNLKDRHSIGIDTPLAAKFDADLQKITSPKLYYKKEGAFSFYMDLVTNTFSKDSYNEGTRYPLDFGDYRKKDEQVAGEILNVFSSWHV